MNYRQATIQLLLTSLSISSFPKAHRAHLLPEWQLVCQKIHSFAANARVAGQINHAQAGDPSPAYAVWKLQMKLMMVNDRQ